MEVTGKKQESSTPVELTYRAFFCAAGEKLRPGRAAWRFCLVEPGDGQTDRGFASLEALIPTCGGN